MPTFIQNESKRFKKHKIANLRRLRGFHTLIYTEEGFSGKGIPNDLSETIGSICVFFSRTAAKWAGNKKNTKNGFIG